MGDLGADGALHVAAGEAKNDPSDRVLPLPRAAMALVATVAAGREAGEPLLGIAGSPGSVATTLCRGVEALVAQAGLAPIPCKALRKSFATVCVNDPRAAPALVEGFLGHKHPGALAVTRRHYLKRLGAGSLRPLADLIDGAFGPEAQA